MNSGIDYLGFEYDSPEAAASAAAVAASRRAASRETGGRGKKRGAGKGGGAAAAAAPRVRDRAFGISSRERMHTAIFGLPGSGKSSIIKLLAYQNIVRGEGFMVIDPHGELARDILSMIPPARYEETIYVNPASLYRFGRTVQINPLQCRTPDEKFVVVMAFVSTLYNLYKDSWGPRLETVLRNAANALVDSDEYNTLGHISEMITDETARNDILKDVTSKNVRHFWEEIFAKQYSKDAGSSAYNKIDKILSTPTVAAMFDAQQSSIDMRQVIEDGMMLVVDLSTGASIHSPSMRPSNGTGLALTIPLADTPCSSDDRANVWLGRRWSSSACTGITALSIWAVAKSHRPEIRVLHSPVISLLKSRSYAFAVCVAMHTLTPNLRSARSISDMVEFENMCASSMYT